METNRIYLQDCYEGMREIPDGSVDLIVTDPPYCVGASSNGKKTSIVDLGMVIPFFRDIFKECVRILKHSRAIYVFTDWRTYPILYSVFNQFFRQRNLIVWNHDRCGPGCFYRPDYELIMFGTLGDSKRSFSPSERDVWKIKDHLGTKKSHPSQKPVELFKKIILDSSQEGDLVLDPFAGSGTTAVAALSTNRKYICFEKETKYVEVAERRIREFHESPKQTALDL